MFHTVQCLNLPNFKKCYVYSTERIYGFCFISKINNINQLVFIMETKCVLCEEGPEILSLLKTWTGICTKAFKIEKIFINFYTLWNGFHHCDKDKNPVSVGNRTELFWLVIYTCNKLGYGCLRIDVCAWVFRIAFISHIPTLRSGIVLAVRVMSGQAWIDTLVLTAHARNTFLYCKQDETLATKARLWSGIRAGWYVIKIYENKEKLKIEVQIKFYVYPTTILG